MRFPLLLFFLVSCSEPVDSVERIPELVLDGDGAFQVTGTNPQCPRLRYRDGQISLNETCAIKLTNKLNPAIPPMYVNGAPIGFC